MNHPLARLRGLAVLAATLAAGSAGCIPPGIAWFPDSTGFVYTGGKDKKQLMVFEVGQKKGRALPVKAGSPAWPAVSPDGKRIALAWTTHIPSFWADNTDRLTVLIVDRAGKVVHRAADIEDVDYSEILQVWWSPRGDRLLISAETWARIYDVQTKKLTRLPGPAVTFGTTPVRPDGKVLLLLHLEKLQYHLVDWDGKEQVIKPILTTLLKNSRDERFQMVRFPLSPDSGWDGKVASATGLGSRFRVDTGRLSVTNEDDKASKIYNPYVRRHHVFPGRVAVHAGGPLEGPGKVGTPRIELVRPGKPPEVLVEKMYFVLFFPSPDGKFLAVHWADDIAAAFGVTKQQDRILVLNARGEVVADLNVAE